MNHGRSIALAGLFLLSLSIGGCPDNFDLNPVLAVRPIVARFQIASTNQSEGADPADPSMPDFLDVPFPSIVYTDPTTNRFKKIPNIKRSFKRGSDILSAQLQQLNGWSRIAPALFLIDDISAPVRDTETKEKGSAKIDLATLPNDEKECASDSSSVFLIDLDENKRVPCRAVYHDESGVDGGQSVLGVGPARGVVLREGGNYVAVLTGRIKDIKGNSVLTSKDFEATAIRGEGPLGSTYGPIYQRANGLAGGATIVSLAPYRTQKVTNEIFALRESIETTPAPVLKWDAASVAPMGAVKFTPKVNNVLPAGWTASLDDWLGVVAADKKLPDGIDDSDESLPVRAHDKIGAFGTAVFEATNFLQTRPSKYDDVDHATFERDPTGKPQPSSGRPTNKIWVSFAIPSSPMPAGGYPAVIIQHGLSSSRQYMLAMANRFCAKGWIAVAIDSVTFGARANDPKYAVDSATDYGNAPGATYKGPDGISDAIGDPPARAGSFDIFGSLKNIGALRDQLRQAELDTAQLVKVLRSNPDLVPLGLGTPTPVTPKVDPERIAYVGDSLGGIEGAVAAAIEPHVKAWVLNVAGGGLLSEVGAHGPAINANLSLAGSLNFGFVGGQYNEGHPVVAIGQALAEGGDPIAYADKLVTAPMPLVSQPTKPRNILQIEVLYDELVANEGNEALARAAGFKMATPNVGPNAGLADLRSRTAFRGGGIDLGLLPAPDSATGYHDTPQPGVTALVAQVSPAHHGADLVRSQANRSYKLPFNSPNGGLTLERFENMSVPNPYRELQDTMLRFFADAFDGKVPAVVGLPAPARDADGDGATDDADREATDKNTK